MNEIDEFSQKVMLDFLQANFPVKRLKDGRRFRRGIIMDGGFVGGSTRNTFMSPKIEREQTFILLSKVLDDVFGFSRFEINMALAIYLNLI